MILTVRSGKLRVFHVQMTQVERKVLEQMHLSCLRSVPSDSIGTFLHLSFVPFLLTQLDTIPLNRDEVESV